MKKSCQNIFNLIFASVLLLVSFSLKAQAFKKGSLLISISEGHNIANYSTSNIANSNEGVHHMALIQGERDPIFIEYGLTNRWGLGLNSGTDNFNINPSAFYGFSIPNKRLVKFSTSELTFEGIYHVYVDRHLDLSVFSSLGVFSVAFKGNESDASYTYNAGGNIIRMGSRARYYFKKRFGILGMVSSYAATCSPKNVKGNNVGTNYSTSLSAFALEFGLCYKFF